MIDINGRIKEVLDKGYLLNLATADSGGPWVAGLLYISDEDMNIFWMSNPDFRHSKALRENPKIAAAITISQKNGEPDLGVQLSGVATKLDGLNHNLALKYLNKKGKPKTSKVIKILREGYCWYKLKPEFIELIDEKNFGFDKQLLKF